MAKTIVAKQIGSPIRRPDIQRRTLTGLARTRCTRPGTEDTPSGAAWSPRSRTWSRSSKSAADACLRSRESYDAPRAAPGVLLCGSRSVIVAPLARPMSGVSTRSQTRHDTDPQNLHRPMAAGASAITVLPFAHAEAHTSDNSTTARSPHPVHHASCDGDPGRGDLCRSGGRGRRICRSAAADLIPVTHEHGDHYNAETLAALIGDGTVLLTIPR